MAGASSAMTALSEPLRKITYPRPQNRIYIQRALFAEGVI
jgi:hypothetical protein